MVLKSYETVAPEGLTFPIGGKEYTPPGVSLRVGVALAAALEDDDNKLLKDESRSLWQMLLGPVYDEMLADDVPAEAVARAGFTVLVDWQAGREAAERVWESGIDPEVQAAEKAATRDGDDSTTSPSTDADASSTNPPESTSDTNSTTAKPTVTRSRGAKSSDSGTSLSPTFTANTESG